MRAAHASCAVLVLAGSCIHRGYPLGTSGDVDIRLDVAAALFAGNDDSPGGARQSPRETGVTLSLTEGGEPAYGAFVDVSVSPPEALALASDSAERDASCAEIEGGFRCTANEDGRARFVARSLGTWSGTASIRVIWGGNAPKEQPVVVLPAGLPAEASDFRLIVGGLDHAARVLATYAPLQCTKDVVPGDLGSKWRPGAVRAREAQVLATAPPGRPDVVENAPVTIESLSADAAVSRDASCEERLPRLLALLDASGQSKPFYLCFSDNGGTARFAVSSGQKRIEPTPEINVAPEPRLLRVRALTTQVTAGSVPVNLFEVSAYNADRERIATSVDVRADDSAVLGLGVLSLTLSGEEAPATVVQVTPLKAGSAAIHVTPRLLDQPDCASAAVTVVPPPP